MQKGFIASLFDFSFTSLVTTRIIKVLYVISMILIGLQALAFTLAAFQVSSGLGLLTLVILAPLGFLFFLAYARVLLEVLIALFRIMENTQQLVAQGGYQEPAGPGMAPSVEGGDIRRTIPPEPPYPPITPTP